MALEGFEPSIGGKWILVRNEKFDEYLSAIGVGFIKRKMAASVTPKVEFIKVADNQIRIVTTGPKKTEDRTVTVGQEVEETDPLDNVIKATITWDPSSCVLTTHVTPTKSGGKKQTITRKVVNSELIMQMEILDDKNPVICKRIFKKDDS